jgi:hypothetical protein
VHLSARSASREFFLIFRGDFQTINGKAGAFIGHEKIGFRWRKSKYGRWRRSQRGGRFLKSFQGIGEIIWQGARDRHANDFDSQNFGRVIYSAKQKSIWK